jgi:hypothetical protein
MKTLTCLAALALVATGAQSQTYYSVDVTNDALYTVNVFTGAATLVGPLSTDVDVVDLAWHQGVLYMKSASSVNGNRVYQVVHNGMWAGIALPGNAVNGGGYQGAEVAGLASNGAGLFATYSVAPPVNFNSNRFAPVNPMSGAFGTPQTLDYDADSMGYASGQFWAVDVVAPGSGCNIYRGVGIPGTFVGNISYDTSLDTNPVDVEDLNPTQLVSVGQTGKFLVRLFKATGMRGTILPITGIPSNAKMSGIAMNPGCAIRIVPIDR